MHKDLQRLKSELRKEKCPPRVLANVANRTAGEPRRFRIFCLKTLGAVAASVLVVTWFAIAWPPGQPTRERSEPPEGARLDKAQAAEDLRFSVALIGHIFLKAGSQTEEVLLKEAVPPLRSGFEAAKKSIIKINKI